MLPAFSPWIGFVTQLQRPLVREWATQKAFSELNVSDEELALLADCDDLVKVALEKKQQGEWQKKQVASHHGRLHSPVSSRAGVRRQTSS